MELTPEYSYVLLRYFSFYLLLLSWRGIAYNVGGMASKGLRSDILINRDERLMRVMNFAYH
jgi:hypothetical protein